MSGWRLTNIQSSFETARDMAGLSDFTFHDLRHTFASHMVMKGVDIVTVSKLLGHANLVMTMRDAHLAPNHLKQAIESIEL
jgi:site-specific recombinase XerD